MKKYKLSLVLGRLNHIHNGHKSLIDKSIKEAEETLVLLGSAQESKTLRNPFSIDTRKRLLKKIYGEKILLCGLDDMSHEHDISFEWGRYILDNVKKITGKKPDVMFYGNDESRKGWFSKKDIEGICEEVIDREIINISATTLRGYIVLNQKEEWEEFVPEEIHEDFEILRNELLEVPVYKEIYGKLEKYTLDEFLKIYKVYEIKEKERKMKR